MDFISSRKGLPLSNVRRWLIPRTKSIGTLCMETARYLRQRARTSANLFPALVKNPKATLSWLVGARVAQIVFLAVLVTVPTLFIPTADWILEAIYPPVSKQELFGLVQMTRQDPRLPGRKGLTQDALWTGGGMLVLALFFLQIPASVERARARSRVDEDKADSLALEQPNTSQLLYQSALKMAIGAEDVSRIEEKIRKLDTSTCRGKARRESHAEDSANEETLAVDSGSGEQFGGGIKVGVEMSQTGKEGRYHLIGLLGHGATGSVYRAYDEVLERDVAIKVLLPDLMNNQKAASRFRQEAKVVAQLTHSHIVQVYDMIESDGRIQIIMELVRGGELADLLREKGRLAIGEACTLGARMAEALAYAHARGVVHRDFKPSNVMLTVSGVPKIMDFGLARFAQSNEKTRMGAILGSPYYMSPEQVQGQEADSRCDVYAMGVVVYQMLTGRVPFEGETIATVMHRQVNEEPLPPSRICSDVPEALDQFVLLMLQKEPNARVRDMNLVMRGLQPFQTC